MNQRQIEVFSAGCPCCDDAVQLVQRLASAADVVKIRPGATN